MAKFTTTKGEFKELLRESINVMAQQGSPELKELIKACIHEVLMEQANANNGNVQVLSPVGGTMLPQQQPQPQYMHMPQQQPPQYGNPYMMAPQQQYGMGYGPQQQPQYGYGPQPPMMMAAPEQVQAQQALQTTVQAAVRNLSRGDQRQAKIFENILADTAQNSLQKTLAYERNGMTPEQGVQDKQDLQKLGGQNVKGRWAELAFNTQPTTMPTGMIRG